jgi:hypothetical protein
LSAAALPRSFHVDGVRIGDLQPIIRANLGREAALMTDQMYSYKEIGREFASHETVTQDEYVRLGDERLIHTNSIVPKNTCTAISQSLTSGIPTAWRLAFTMGNGERLPLKLASV